TQQLVTLVVGSWQFVFDKAVHRSSPRFLPPKSERAVEEEQDSTRRHQWVAEPLEVIMYCSVTLNGFSDQETEEVATCPSSAKNRPAISEPTEWRRMAGKYEQLGASW